MRGEATFHPLNRLPSGMRDAAQRRVERCPRGLAKGYVSGLTFAMGGIRIDEPADGLVGQIQIASQP